MTAPAERFAAAIADRYRIDGTLGAGGMATVYRAHDVRHDRAVAIKVIHPELAAVLGAERFLAEIKTTAALQHPHILPLFDSGQADGLLYYVMPLVSGESLRARLDRETQLPLDEAVHIACAVADALEHAHARGVVHRDIKPENLLLQDGHALVADFGIALAVQSAGGGRLTQTGLSLGTPQYMAPEQAMGERVVDRRADVFAMGAVLYEMLTGEPPFTGPSAQAIVAKVLTAEPQRPSALRPTIPPALEAALLKALQKLPADRHASAAAFAAALRGGTPESIGLAPSAATLRAGAPASRRWTMPVLVATSLGMSAVALWAWQRPTPSPAAVVRVPLDLGAQRATSWGIALSADGRTIVFVGSDTARRDARGRAPDQLFVRSLDDERVVPIDGTDSPGVPVLSPDGTEVAFVRTSGSSSQMIRLSLRGGAAQTSAIDGGWAGAAWSDDDRLYYSRGGALYVVPASGGPSARIPVPDSLARGIFGVPALLPDDRHLVVGWTPTRGAPWQQLLMTRDGAEVTALGIPVENAYPVDAGYLVYPDANAVRAIGFDLKRRRTVGEPVAIAAERPSNRRLAVSRDGTVLYATGDEEQSNTLVEVDRRGREEALPLPAAPNLQPRYSPDGRRIALSRQNFNGDLWIYEPATRRAERLTTDSVSSRPTWTADGTALVFMRFGNPHTVHRIDADGLGTSTPLFARDSGNIVEAQLLPGDSLLVFREDRLAPGMRDIYLAPLARPTELRPLAATASNERGIAVTADGRWLAFVSDRTGRDEVYIRRILPEGPPSLVSTNGGVEPRWRPDGGELYFRGPDSLFAVTLRLDEAPRVAPPTALFADPYRRMLHEANYDVTPDGRRFVFIRRDSSERRITAHLVLHWFTQSRGLGSASMFGGPSGVRTGR